MVKGFAKCVYYNRKVGERLKEEEEDEVMLNVGQWGLTE